MTQPALSAEQIADIVRTAPQRRRDTIARCQNDPVVQAMLRRKPGDPPVPGTTTHIIPLQRF